MANTTGDLVFYDYSASAERFRIKTDGRIGIQNNLTNTYDSTYNKICIGDGAAANIGVTFHTSSAHGTYLGFKDTADANVQGLISYTHHNDYMGFRTNGSERVYIDSGGKLWVDRTHASATTGNHPALDIDTYANGTAGSTFATGIDFRVAGVHKKRMVVTNGSGTGGGDWIFYRDNGNNVGLRIDSSGYVTHPNQPCMCVKINLSGLNNSGDLFRDYSNHLAYDVNNNIAFTASNGRWTIPVDGNYLVSFYSIKEGASVSGYVDIVVNGVSGNFLRAYSQNSATSWSTYSAFGIKTLSKGDYLNVVYPGAAANWNAHGLQHMRFVIALHS